MTTLVSGEDEQVGLAGEGSGLSAEVEGVLVLNADVVASLGPLVSLLVEEARMVGKPVGLVEVGRLLGPALMVGFEPDGPLAGVLAGEQAWKSGGPDVGVFSSLWHDTAPW